MKSLGTLKPIICQNITKCPRRKLNTVAFRLISFFRTNKTRLSGTKMKTKNRKIPKTRTKTIPCRQESNNQKLKLKQGISDRNSWFSHELLCIFARSPSTSRPEILGFKRNFMG
jgi:hypothetical protein